MVSHRGHSSWTSDLCKVSGSCGTISCPIERTSSRAGDYLTGPMHASVFAVQVRSGSSMLLRPHLRLAHAEHLPSNIYRSSNVGTMRVTSSPEISPVHLCSAIHCTACAVLALTHPCEILSIRLPSFCWRVC